LCRWATGARVATAQSTGFRAIAPTRLLRVQDDETKPHAPSPADLAAMGRRPPQSGLGRAAPPPGAPAAAPPADVRKKVVIAEDEALIRLDLKETLDELGYE